MKHMFTVQVEDKLDTLNPKLVNLPVHEEDNIFVSDKGQANMENIKIGGITLIYPDYVEGWVELKFGEPKNNNSDVQ